MLAVPRRAKVLDRDSTAPQLSVLYSTVATSGEMEVGIRGCVERVQRVAVSIAGGERKRSRRFRAGQTDSSSPKEAFSNFSLVSC